MIDIVYLFLFCEKKIINKMSSICVFIERENERKLKQTSNFG